MPFLECCLVRTVFEQNTEIVEDCKARFEERLQTKSENITKVLRGGIMTLGSYFYCCLLLSLFQRLSIEHQRLKGLLHYEVIPLFLCLFRPTDGQEG